MAAARIVVVGGGSQFAIGLSESLIDYGRDSLAGSTVVLLDIDGEAVAKVHRFASRLASDAGVDMAFEAATDRREAFPGADYVLTTFRPGSHAELLQDETVPPKHGLQGNETVGIGGIFMACRVAPVLREICADAEALCPGAWFVNYTNPTQFVADTIGRISSLKVVSLCDGFLDDVETLASFLEVPASEIALHPAGTNHAMWHVRFTVAGEDGYPLLRARLADLSDEEIDDMFRPGERVDVFGGDFAYDEVYKQFIAGNGFPLQLKLFRIFGLLPGPRYYWRYLLEQDRVIAAQRAGGYVTMADFYVRHAEPLAFAGLEERLAQATVELRSSRREGGGGHGDLAVRVINAMANDLGETFVVNVRNRGAISNLADDAVVEVSASVDRAGPHPFAAGALPDGVVGLQQSLVRSQQLAVTAALSGDRGDLLRAIVAHPLVHDVGAAEACMDELLGLQAELLPQFRGRPVAAAAR